MSGLSEELKPCPFCGGEAVFRERPNPPNGMIVLGCDTHGCPGNCACYDMLSEAEAITAWNTRTQSPTPEEVERATANLRVYLDNCAPGIRFLRASALLRTYGEPPDGLSLEDCFTADLRTILQASEALDGRG